MTKSKRERKASELANRNPYIEPQTYPVYNDTPANAAVNFTLQDQPLQITFNHTQRDVILADLRQNFNLTLNTSSNLSRIVIYALECFYGYQLIEKEDGDRFYEPVFDSLELSSFGNVTFTSTLLNFTRALNASCLEPDPEPYWTELRIELTEIFIIIGILLVIGACVFKACCVQPVHAQDALIAKLKKTPHLPVPAADYFLNADEIYEYRQFIENTIGEGNRNILKSKLANYSEYLKTKCLFTQVPVAELIQPVTIIVNHNNPDLRWSCTVDAKRLAQKIASSANPELEISNAPPIKLLNKHQVIYSVGHDAEIVKFINSIKTRAYAASRPHRHRPPSLRVSDKPQTMFSWFQTRKKTDNIKTEKTKLLQMTTSPKSSRHNGSIN